MPDWPPTRTLIVHRSNWYSRTGVVSLIEGALFNSEYPLTNLTDGLAGPMTRFDTTSVWLRVTLTGSQNANILGILNHNLDPDLLIQPYINGVALPRTFSVKYPHCWIDLRAFATDPFTATGIPVTSADIRITGNSQKIAMSEIVIAGGYIFNGTIEPPWTRGIRTGTVRRRVDGDRLIEAGLGTFVRPLRLNLTLTAATEGVNLQSVWTDTGEHGEQVLVVPTTRRNDLYLVRWPPQRRYVVERSAQRVKVQLDLLEEAGGLVI